MDSPNRNGDVVGFTYKLCNDGCLEALLYSDETNSCAKYGLGMVQWGNATSGPGSKTKDWCANPARFGETVVPDSNSVSRSTTYLCGTNDADTSGGISTKQYDKLMARSGVFKIKYFVEDKAGNNQEKNYKGNNCASRGTTLLTPIRTVTVKDSLPPVITLHIDADQDE